MEGENKVEDKILEASETKVDSSVGEAGKKVSFVEKMKKVCCNDGSCKINCKNKGLIVAAVILLLLVAGSYGYKQYRQKIDLGSDAVKTKVEKFLSENVPATAKTGIKDITKDGDLYKITVTVDKQEIPIFVTRDGKKLIQAQGVIDLDQKPADPNAQAQAPEKTEAENKTDVPVVDLFVMSYCPYGLQMERGVLPAVEALGAKIKFNVKFVDYTLHGQKEVTENVNQYCIGKTQPTKLNNYLKCFWKDSKGTAAACMKTAGVNAASVATCVADTNKEFNPTEKAMGLNKEETVKFGVQGSPTLVINGTTVSSSRDSASVLKAICSGFTTQPKECEAKLSTTAPAAGFDDEAAAAGGAASAASCATPTN
ncbi:MAG TPA: hypothetical protein DEA43_01720 [Candidatus Moranbacteria bacterium]|nr:hypothetical protein [Candidatus Moranbacteria bacterium]HBT45586.1 hypothetical protein [Candidatus Moranbacteria bacterium]